MACTTILFTWGALKSHRTEANDGSIDGHMFRGWIGNAVKHCEPASRCLYLKHGVQMD